MATKHPQVHVRVGDREADVDEELAPLIEALWQRGIGTYMSCQDGAPPGYVWLLFFAGEAAERFLAHFDPPLDSALYQRMRGHDDDRPWLYGAVVDDWAVREHQVDGEWVESKTSPSEWALAVAVRFPRVDFDAVREAFGLVAG